MVSPARVERATQRGLSSRRLPIAPWGRWSGAPPESRTRNIHGLSVARLPNCASGASFVVSMMESNHRPFAYGLRSTTELIDTNLATRAGIEPAASY